MKVFKGSSSLTCNRNHGISVCRLLDSVREVRGNQSAKNLENKFVSKLNNFYLFKKLTYRKLLSIRSSNRELRRNHVRKDAAGTPYISAINYLIRYTNY